MSHRLLGCDDMVQVVGPDPRGKEATVTVLERLREEGLFSSPRRHMLLIIILLFICYF